MLAEGLNNMAGVNIDLGRVHSNIVYFKLHESKISYSSQLVQLMKDKGILFFEVSPNRYRLVTHYGIQNTDIKTTLSILNNIVKK